MIQFTDVFIRSQVSRGLLNILTVLSTILSMIMTSGDRWSILKINDQSFSIMEHTDIVLSEVVDIYIFYWYGKLGGS